MKHEFPRFLILAGTCITACILTVSCQEPNYRTEVTTGEQGRPQVHQVPYATPPAAAAPHVAQREQPCTEPNPTPTPTASSDSDLAAVESVWPRLSAEDRKTVANMARRLAPPPK